MNKFAILAASLLTAGTIASSFRAEAAPDFRHVFDHNGGQMASIPQIPKNVADPGAGHYTAILESSIASTASANTKLPAQIAMQDTGAFTNVFPPSFLSVDGTVKTASKPWLAEAGAADNPFVIDSAEYSSRMHDKEMMKIDNDVIKAAGPALHARLIDSARCDALDARLDKQHLRYSRELSALAAHDCMTRTAI
jgi:hypothetical protein